MYLHIFKLLQLAVYYEIHQQPILTVRFRMSVLCVLCTDVFAAYLENAACFACVCEACFTVTLVSVIFCFEKINVKKLRHCKHCIHVFLLFKVEQELSSRGPPL